MTDAIAQAAEQLNQQPDAQQASSEVGKPEANSSSGTSSGAQDTPVTLTSPTSSVSSAQGDSGNAVAVASDLTSGATASATASGSLAGDSGNVVGSAPMSASTSGATIGAASQSAIAPQVSESQTGSIATTDTAGEASGELLTGTGSATPLPVSISPVTSDTGTTAATADVAFSSQTESAVPLSTEGEQGNVGAATAAQSSQGSTPAPAESQVDSTQSLSATTGSGSASTNPTPTDSVIGSPTGGPIAGAGATPDAKAKHGLLDRLEADLRAELRAVEELPGHALHILAAVFGRHHSTVDVEAAS